MSKDIFISYRRKDTPSAAGRLYDVLCDAFGSQRVFKDLDSIARGADFRKVIGQELLRTKVVLLLIGDRYTTLKDQYGQVRIMKDDDYVREEAAYALAFKNEKLVIPLLVDGATMPTPDKLPDDLQDLPFLNASELSSRRWKHDVDILLDDIKSHLNPQAPPRPPRPEKRATNNGKTIAIVLGALLLFILGAMLLPDLIQGDKKSKGHINPVPTYDINPVSFTGMVDNTPELNMRDAPGTSNSNVLYVLGRGDELNVQGSKADDDGKLWYLVDHLGTNGWVSSSYITNKEDYKTKPAYVPEQESNAELIKGTWKFDAYYINGIYSNNSYLNRLHRFDGRNITILKDTYNSREVYSYTVDEFNLYFQGESYELFVNESEMQWVYVGIDAYGYPMTSTYTFSKQY